MDVRIKGTTADKTEEAATPSMVQHSMIGQILQSFGRISEKDVEDALEYQKSHGGYFGEALLELGFVTREELDWGLASQFDIPYVFPDPDSVDLEAAALVTPEWALANLTLPILKTADTLNVIVDTPIWSEAVEELQSQTNLKIELGLASSSKIRELIREVYRDEVTEAPERKTVQRMSLDGFFAAADGAESPRFGISVRSNTATGWFEHRASVERVPLDQAWSTDIENVLSPPPIEARTGADQDAWDAEVVREGRSARVRVHFLGGGGGQEYVFEPLGKETDSPFEGPSPAILSEIRILESSGAARFVVTTTPAELGAEILHHLPGLLLENDARTVALTNRSQFGPDGLFVRTLTEDPDELRHTLESLRIFRFEAVSADLGGDPRGWVDQVLDVARTAFVLWNDERDRQVAHVAGVRWHLQIARKSGDRLEWNLQPLRT